MDDIDTLIDSYLSPTAHQNQIEHLRTGTMPFQMSHEQLGSQLHVINHLGCYLPHSNIAGVHFDLFAMEDILKRTYFFLIVVTFLHCTLFEGPTKAHHYYLAHSQLYVDSTHP